MAVLSSQQIFSYASKVGLTPSQANVATAIAIAESSGNTSAINPGRNGVKEYSVGLWQINTLAHPQYDVNRLTDPLYNANAMFAVSGGGTDWTPWTTYTDGRYRNYLSLNNTGVIQTSFIPNPPGGGTTQDQPGNPTVTSTIGSGYQYILAYVVAGLIFALMARTRIGYRAIYYGLALLLLLLLVTQSKFIAGALQPITLSDATAQAQETRA